MSSAHRLPLHEEALLLALKDEEGTSVSGAMWQYAIGGAVLAELLMEGRLELDGSEKKPVVRVADRAQVDEPFLDGWLRTIADAKKPRSLTHWVQKIAGKGGVKEEVATSLCRKGVLRASEDRVLWIFRRKIYPEIDSGPEREIVGRLEEAIFTDTEEIDPRTAALVALGHKTGLLNAVFEKKKVKERKERIEAITDGSAAGKATDDAVSAALTAMRVAVTVPTVTAATS